MKKRNLLAMAALSCFAFTANAAEYWVIKDGKLNEDITIMPNTTDAVFDVLTSGNATTGAKYQHNENKYKDVQIDLTAWPLSLKDTWVMEMEYKVPATALDPTGPHSDLWDGKKPMFIFGMYPDTGKYDVNVAPIRIDIDGKFSAQADTWTTVKKFVYANPSVDSCKVLTLSYCREVGTVMDPIYIKNLKFIDGEGGQRPFYAEDFECVGSSRIVVYSDEPDYGYYGDSQLTGGKAVSSKSLIKVGRLWEDNGHDGSWFMDDENYHALHVPAAGKDITIAGIEIPAELSNGGEIAFKAYIKNLYVNGSGFESATDEQRIIPAVIKFDNGTEIQITDSLMDGQWDAIKSVIAVPAGAKTIDLIFKSNSDFGYVVDNVRIGANWIGDNVATIASDIEIEITPNPATDIITVSGDVEKIEVIALNGAVVASAEGNQANIASLAAGSYIVKAYTAEGIAFKSIIKK
ncbi:MAG: T9SS type A sorting domain-containing protein [Bacteroidales bacterium]|nr:T9SS type A sorting domain-containing protein [Bacteroidales bacterium]